MPSKTPVSLKRRRTDDARKGKSAKPFKKFKKQKEYHSSSEDEESEEAGDFNVINLADSGDEVSALAPELKVIVKAKSILKPPREEPSEEEVDADDEIADDENFTDRSGSESEGSDGAPRKKRKRNDPDAFATSMSKILGSKLSTSKRSDPVLSRSKDALLANKELADSKLEAKARHKMRQDKKDALEKGRVKDVLGLDTPDVSSAEIIEQERKLKKTAQRGVIKLFNAVYAAQRKAQEAEADARKSGVIGLEKRKERATEMSKEGFLDLIAGGGKKNVMESTLVEA